MPTSMMPINRIVSDLRASNQKQAYQTLCDIAAQDLAIDSIAALRRIMEKERASADSAMGGGVGLPFTRLLKIQKPYAILGRLQEPLDCGAPDGIPLNLICLLLFPRTNGMQHLTQIARMSRLLKDADMQQKIKMAKSEDAIRSILIDPDGWMMAA